MSLTPTEISESLNSGNRVLGGSGEGGGVNIRRVKTGRWQGMWVESVHVDH